MIVLWINPLDYSQIISCFISLFCRISNQLLLFTRGKRLQGAYHLKSDWVLHNYGTCRAYAENNGDDFEQAKIFIEELSFSFK